MNNRWGKPVEQKGSLRGSGQNNINININFNAMKDKSNAFAGRKIDNFIEVSNQSKPNISRPNVSMETLKTKAKKPLRDEPAQSDLLRKKSKSKLNDYSETPEKIPKQRQAGNSRSLGKKSTKKRSAKSYDIKGFFGKIDPLSNSRQDEESRENSKQVSKSKSKSKEKSNKKLSKNLSKSKIPTSSTNTRAKNTTHNSKKESEEEKERQRQRQRERERDRNSLKVKKPKKVEKVDKAKNEQGSNSQVIKKKPSMERIPRKKSSCDESKKVPRVKTPKKIGDKDTKSLKRLPLYYEDEDEPFDEDISYKKLKKQAQLILYQEEEEEQVITKHRKIKDSEDNQTAFTRYLTNKHTYDDIKFLRECAIIIQKNWRGYRARSQFINELDMMNHNIQMTKNKIANLDPVFWDDAQSNSILKADDAVSAQSNSEVISQLNSEIEKSVSCHSNNNQISKKRIIEEPDNQHLEMIERIAKLEENLKKEQLKAQQLEEENKELKVNLQKVNINSGFQSMEQSLKSDKSWEIAFKNLQDPFMEEQSQQNKNDQSEVENKKDQVFSLRMPVKKETKPMKEEKLKEIELMDKSAQSISQDSNSQKLKKMKNKVQKFECSSPKFSPKININSSILELFQKKEQQIKQSYDKKASIYDRMLNDSIFSPRTYNLKKNQLNEKFRQQTETIRTKKDEVARVAQYIQEIEKEQPKKVEKVDKSQEPKHEPSKPTSIVCEKNHIIQDYGNANLNSHRSRSDAEEADQFESSVESDKSNTIFKRNVKQDEGLNQEIQGRNSEVIRIFHDISEHHHKEQQSIQVEQNKVSSESDNRLFHGEIEQKKPKGFETALLFIRQYCLSLIEFIRGSEQHRTTFLEGVCSPIIYDSVQLLKSYRTTVENQSNSSYNSQQMNYIYPFFKLIYPKSQVISRDAFTEFNSIYKKLQIDCSYPAEREFFLNSLLDAFNESLDYKRPCSFYGLPPAWVFEHRALKNYGLNEEISDKEKFINSEKFDQICGVSIARVMEWSASLCGFIPESPEMENIVIDEQQINQIRETRIAVMLQKDLLENEEHLLDSTIEKTQVKLYMSLIIERELVQEVFNEINSIFC